MLLVSHAMWVVWMLLPVVGRALVSQAMLRHTPLMRLVRIAMCSTPSVSSASVPSRLVVLSSVLIDVVLLDAILVHGQSIALKALHLVPILVIVFIGAQVLLIAILFLTTHHLIWCSGVAPRLHGERRSGRHVRASNLSSMTQEFLLTRHLREGIDVLIVMVWLRRLILLPLRSIWLRLLLLLHLVWHLLLNVWLLVAWLLLLLLLLLLLHAILRLLWFGLLLLSTALLAFALRLLLLLGLHLHGGGLLGLLRLLLLASALLFALLFLLPLLGSGL